ncbi:MAG: hypothetical protein IEMM0008_0932 [bacterium]|nr:MAG: hypothetical protein IEMM0008_0932 [bacterium]
MFSWRNHPKVREKSFDTSPLIWEEHEKWFQGKIQDSKSSIYIVYKGKDKIASIRFDEQDELVKVSVMINPAFIGQGSGAEVIKLGTEEWIRDKYLDKPVIAEIKGDNVASIKAFEKAGFKESFITYVWNQGEKVHG